MGEWQTTATGGYLRSNALTQQLRRHWHHCRQPQTSRDAVASTPPSSKAQWKWSALATTTTKSKDIWPISNLCNVICTWLDTQWSALEPIPSSGKAITLKRLRLQRKGVLPEPVFPHYKHRQPIREPFLEQSYLFHITPMWLFGIGCMCTSISLFWHLTSTKVRLDCQFLLKSSGSVRTVIVHCHFCEKRSSSSLSQGGMAFYTDRRQNLFSFKISAIARIFPRRSIQDE